MKDLLLFQATKLCKHKDNIRIIEEVEDDSTEYVLYVHQDDIGAIMGKHGRTVRAIRTLLAISSAKLGQRVTLRLDVIPAGVGSPASSQKDSPLPQSPLPDSD
jgi:predicted RNA-binding protein YlqC (UPF0109 family)